MTQSKFIVKLNSLGRNEIVGKGLDLLLKEDKAFICESIDFISSFVFLKILSPEDWNLKFDVWLPQNYIQFLLKGDDDKSQEILGFQIDEPGLNPVNPQKD